MDTGGINDGGGLWKRPHHLSAASELTSVTEACGERVEVSGCLRRGKCPRRARVVCGAGSGVIILDEIVDSKRRIRDPHRYGTSIVP